MCVLVLVLVLGARAANLEPSNNHFQLRSESTSAPDNSEEDLHDSMTDEPFLPGNTQKELHDPSQDWQANMSLYEVMEYLFVYKVGADVTFNVINKEGPSEGVPFAFQAHKTILMARSSVISEMLKN